MHRRKILAAVLTGASAIFSITSATKPASASTTDGSKVVYHLTDLDKVDFVLGNIRNHFDGTGGPNKVTIALVVHGPALKASVASTPQATCRSGPTNCRNRVCRCMPAAIP
jgi:uncharacterized protein